MEESLAQVTNENVIVANTQMENGNLQDKQPTAKQAFLQEQEVNNLMSNHSVIGTYVRQYVRNILFKKIKFIQGDDAMCYAGRICRKVLSGVKIHCGIEVTNEAKWWEKYRKEVRTTIDRQRSSCGVSMKSCFLGMSYEFAILTNCVWLEKISNQTSCFFI